MDFGEYTFKCKIISWDGNCLKVCSKSKVLRDLHYSGCKWVKKNNGYTAYVRGAFRNHAPLDMILHASVHGFNDFPGKYTITVFYDGNLSLVNI